MSYYVTLCHMSYYITYVILHHMSYYVTYITLCHITSHYVTCHIISYIYITELGLSTILLPIAILDVNDNPPVFNYFTNKIGNTK